ncbi:hypothetical protein BDM02DRAFT_1315712 [Thelephora ganbajun]|uniref:Uncharacterized protein n=1 Tax=Thelephora ganbajun TaxID=370292 RepID=A0ACB6Z2E1_THEGA|nr:hypothetical protein BDM02DRAFT_1315712 [Thelephora ganbajun]
MQYAIYLSQCSGRYKSRAGRGQLCRWGLQPHTVGIGVFSRSENTGKSTWETLSIHRVFRVSLSPENRWEYWPENTVERLSKKVF